MLVLKQSPVIFDEENHTYHLGDKRLLGITGLIHSVLGLGVYPDADDYMKDRIIPRAGSRGTAVHHAIQTYDQIGIKQTQQIVRTRYGCVERNNVEYVDECWDVTTELHSYIRHLEGFIPLANELTVSDNKKYASQIDNVWQNRATLGIWLVDTKTNNTDVYPVCGYFNPRYFNNGEDALKEYLSWQLSVYAELFEAENPGLCVEGLACNWLRKDRSALWRIERKPKELVLELLSTDYFIGDNGPVYFHHDPSVFGIGASQVKTELTPIVPPHFIDEVTILLKDYNDVERRLEEAKKVLRQAMSEHGLKSFNFGPFSVTISADSVSNTFDTKRFKSDHADLYTQYLTPKNKKGSLTIKQKDDD